MKDATKRSIIRSIHLVLSIPIIAYVYSPFEQLPAYAPRVRFVVVPLMVLSGLWMWKGHLLRRLMVRRSADQSARRNPSHERASRYGGYQSNPRNFRWNAEAIWRAPVACAAAYVDPQILQSMQPAGKRLKKWMKKFQGQN